MLAVVKTPHIKIHIEGRIPPRLITLLKKEYGKGVRLVALGPRVWARRGMLPVGLAAGASQCPKH